MPPLPERSRSSSRKPTGQPFVGQTLIFAVDASTQVKLKGGAIVDGDHGTPQVKGAPGLDLTGLQLLTPKLVVDQA
jgi:hypothetical protein